MCVNAAFACSAGRVRPKVSIDTQELELKIKVIVRYVTAGNQIQVLCNAFTSTLSHLHIANSFLLEL